MTNQPDEIRAGRAQTVVRKLIGPIFRRCFDLTIEGLDRVPLSSAAVIAANHTSVLDSFLVPAILPRSISYVGKAEYLDDWKTKHIFPALGMIPIDRRGGSAAQRALDMAAGILDDGELFAIYPEGTRSRTGDLYKGRTGVARLAFRTNSPIIPVGLVGMRDIQPPDASFPKLFQPATVRFGEPIHPADFGDPADDPLVYRAMTDALMFCIRELSGQRYINRYAPSAEDVADLRANVVVDKPLADGRTATDLLSAERENKPTASDLLNAS
jgi:1-acyl-sn-glycerol-3-phosphate acyltransferase